MLEGLGPSLNTIRDTIAFAEGLLLVDRCIETLKDNVLKLEVQAIANMMRPTPQTPLIEPFAGKLQSCLLYFLTPLKVLLLDSAPCQTNAPPSLNPLR
ncbi:hypothetical protein N7501_004507 [Penicillium viridicatum]|nr:hypothetical protein N7501_004507 [Penicillium viridicatum]